MRVIFRREDIVDIVAVREYMTVCYKDVDVRTGIWKLKVGSACKSKDRMPVSG